MSATMSSKGLEDLNLSRDEVSRIGKALKDETFRKMLMEYAEEISDPENKKRYEADIRQMEMDRGMDIAFVHPEAGYVLKTSIDGNVKAFINICKNDKIGKPSSKRQPGPDGRTGMQWSIPHSFAPPRDDVDRSGQKCKVFDVVFHPDTYRMAETNDRFKSLVNDTALDGIERQFDVKVDRRNVKNPKMKFKGTPTATVIRSKAAKGDKAETPENVSKPAGDDPLENMPYPYDNKTSEEKAAENEKNFKLKQEKNKSELKSQQANTRKDLTNVPTEPTYTLTHRSEVDLQEYRDAPDSRPSTRPTELVISVHLPLLNSATAVSLDIFERRLLLESKKPAAYKLDLTLPYPVDDNLGSAKFDKSKNCLTITLPVIKQAVPKLPSFINNDESNNHLCDADHINEQNHTPLIEEQNHTPLIEELPSETTNLHSENIKQSDANISNTDIDHVAANNIVTEQGIEHLTSSRNISGLDNHIQYSFPSFIYRQDRETVSFVFDVKNVSHDSVIKQISSASEMSLKFDSIGSGRYPMPYCFLLRFPETSQFELDLCRVDVAKANVVLLLKKACDMRTNWQKFWAGVDKDHLEEKFFVTEYSVIEELQQLETEALYNQNMVKHVTDDQRAQLEVTEMSDEALQIKIKPSKNRKQRALRLHLSKLPHTEEEEDEEYDAPLSPDDIQVVHNKEAPPLHGILKLRSRSHSESSDDICSSSNYSREHSTTSTSSSSGSCLSECTISESEEHEDGADCEVKKCVSFSDHIDKTMYKSCASPNSIKTALKSKRRRQRRKEEKRQRGSGGGGGRRRRHSSSEYSSGDEHVDGDKQEVVMGLGAEANTTEPILEDDSGKENQAHAVVDCDRDSNKAVENVSEVQADVATASVDTQFRTKEGVVKQVGSEVNIAQVGNDGGGEECSEQDQDCVKTAISSSVITSSVITNAVPSSPRSLSTSAEVKRKLAEVDHPDDADVDSDDECDRISLRKDCDNKGLGSDGVSSVPTAGSVGAVNNPNDCVAVSECDGVKKCSDSAVTDGVGDAERVLASRSCDTRDSPLQDDKQVNRTKEKITSTTRGHGTASTPTQESDVNDAVSNSAGDTTLSWAAPPLPAGGVESEHKTECVFTFSNSVMYDLD